MRDATRALAMTALAISVVALLRPVPRAADAAPPADLWKAQCRFPPLVFSSKAWLDCSISSTAKGRQVMRTMSGQGFSFDSPMLPIKDGQVQLKNPGMMYKFDAFPPAVVPARFTGLGEGAITEMKAEVEVDVRRYRQPGGKGTTIFFQAKDISPNSAYVEFTGVFVRKRDHKPFPFRVVFGSVSAGEGKVTPASPAPRTNIASKAVVLGRPQAPATVTTALYEAEDDVRALH